MIKEITRFYLFTVRNCHVRVCEGKRGQGGVDFCVDSGVQGLTQDTPKSPQDLSVNHKLRRSLGAL
jgi:hypothetical protein